MSQPHRISTGNRILDALPEDEFNRLQRGLEPVPFALKQTLHHAGAEIPFIYFPVRGIVSMVTMLHDGSAIEVATVGREGLIGLSALLGNAISTHEVMVQGAGFGLRASASVLQDEFHRSEAFRDIVLRFAEIFIEQISQTAACNGRHDLEARCARWLLTMSDRLETDHFPLTQDFLAMLLGAQRTGINAVAVAFQRRGIIRYNHGRITILDRAKLEAAACECHRIIKNRIDGFLGPAPENDPRQPTQAASQEPSDPGQMPSYAAD